MTEEKRFTIDECHKNFAVDLFNVTWSFLDKEDRTKEEDDKMIHAAHASRFHWCEIGKPLQFERGEWQISRVYAVLNRPQPALYHAKRCLEICEQNNIGDFDIAFAYEAMARAYALAGNKTQREKYIQLAEIAGQKIKKKEDKNYFFNQLKAIPSKR